MAPAVRPTPVAQGVDHVGVLAGAPVPLTPVVTSYPLGPQPVRRDPGRAQRLEGQLGVGVEVGVSSLGVVPATSSIADQMLTAAHPQGKVSAT